MDGELVCVTLRGTPAEPEAAFKARLVEFWSAYLRASQDDYDQVYAEATKFEQSAGRPTRQYMVRPEGVAPLKTALEAAKMDYAPIDEDELYSKYEATSPDWFQLD